MSPYRIFPLALALGAFLAVSAPESLIASQLILSNGDRLTGTVIKREDGKVYFHSDVLGDIVAPENAVTIVEPPAAPMPVESLAGLPPKPNPPPAPAAPAVAEVHVLGLLPWLARPLLVLKPVVTKWSGKVELGYGNELTTVRTITTTVRADAERNVGPDDVLFKGLYLYGSSERQPTTDQDEADFQWRHRLDERLFTQALTSYSSDKIRLINTNVEQTADLGYKLYATARETANVGIGVTAQYFDATGVQKGSGYLGNIFQDYTYRINGRYTLIEDISAQYSPDKRARFGALTAATPPVASKPLNYDYKFHATLQGKINSRLSLNLHFEYEYDNAVLDPRARADQHVLTTLGYGF